MKSLPHCVDEIRRIAHAAKGRRPDVLVLCHGGPIASPEDAQFILERCPEVIGFYGVNWMERPPTEAVRSWIRARWYVQPVVWTAAARMATSGMKRRAVIGRQRVRSERWAQCSAGCPHPPRRTQGGGSAPCECRAAYASWHDQIYPYAGVFIPWIGVTGGTELKLGDARAIPVAAPWTSTGFPLERSPRARSTPWAGTRGGPASTLLGLR